MEKVVTGADSSVELRSGGEREHAVVSSGL